jgi:hypothetical protein
MDTGPSESISGASSVRRQTGDLSDIRYLTLVPICGASDGGSTGSIAILFHTLGGAVSSTCSASRTLPDPSVTRPPLSVSAIARTGVRVNTRAAPMAATSFAASCWLPPLQR